VDEGRLLDEQFRLAVALDDARDERVQTATSTGVDVAADPPRSLGSRAWARWRREHPPSYLLPANRRGDRCGACSQLLEPLTRLCYRCHRAEREAAR
jgi:hypothetical protein